jgi:hypothetical protein
MPERRSDRRTKMVGAGFAAVAVALAAVLLALQHPWHDKPPHFPLPVTQTARH